jgi:hypothetical protein
MKALLCCLLLAAPLAAQQRDFLTESEIQQLRDIQEANARLQLYAKFARERVDLLKDLLAKEKAGRSAIIHETLDGYTKILDAIDGVADEALLRRTDIKLGLKAVADAEKEMLPVLQKIQESQPKDLERYSFALQQAIDTTSDSLEAALDDLGKRTEEVQAREDREKKQIEASMTPSEREAKRVEEKKAEESQKKAPTLMRKGEKKK